MHVLFVTGEYPPLPGGVGAYTAALGRALMTQGVRVSVLTSTLQSVSAFDSAVEGAPVNQPAVYPTVRRWSWRMAHDAAARAIALQADWIHVQYQTAAYGMHPAINFAPLWWQWQPRLPRLGWTYHDLLVPYLFPKAGARLRRWVTYFPATRCDAVVVTNRADAERLAAQGLKAITIPIGSNIPHHELSPAEQMQRRRQRGYDAADLIVGYFGFLNRSKGGLTLVRAVHELLQRHDRVQLLMIGAQVGASDPTDSDYLQSVHALIHQLGLTTRVQWTGFQSDAEVSADLAICDVVLLPYADGASLRRGSLMAALTHGCAVVTTQPDRDLDGAEDGRELLFVPAEDAAAAANGVTTLLHDRALAQRLRLQARQFSRRYAWTTIARRHLDLYIQDPAAAAKMAR